MNQEEWDPSYSRGSQRKKLYAALVLLIIAMMFFSYSMMNFMMSEKDEERPVRIEDNAGGIDKEMLNVKLSLEGISNELDSLSEILR